MLRILPLPTAAATIDFVCKRKPRHFAVYLDQAGTVGGGEGSTALVGTGTAGTPNMIGCVVRVSADANPPTNEVDVNPAPYGSVVESYVSPTQLVLTDLSHVTFANSPCALSDPIDVEEGAMINSSTG
jgi:hypothetical protein